VDGANSGEWGLHNLIALDMANDDPRSLQDNWTMHESPWDLSHLWAAWDDQHLYLAWQYVDVTDIIDPANAGSAGGGSPHSMDLIQWIAFDTLPAQGAVLDMWGKNGGEPYWTGVDQPDYQIYIASNLWQGYFSRAVDGTFVVDDGGIDYFPIEELGIEVATEAGFAADQLWGVGDVDDRNDPGSLRDFIAEGHDRGRDTFYEMSIPLEALGLDREGLERGGLGVMVGQGEFSCMDTIPHDPATLNTPGVGDSNSSLEWSDVDSLSVNFARVGAAQGACPDCLAPDFGVHREDMGTEEDMGGAGDSADGAAGGGAGEAGSGGAEATPLPQDVGRTSQNDAGLILQEETEDGGGGCVQGHGAPPWFIFTLLALSLLRLRLRET